MKKNRPDFKQSIKLTKQFLHMYNNYAFIRCEMSLAVFKGKWFEFVSSYQYIYVISSRR